jgi:carbonic anhydrase
MPPTLSLFRTTICIETKDLHAQIQWSSLFRANKCHSHCRYTHWVQGNLRNTAARVPDKPQPGRGSQRTHSGIRPAVDAAGPNVEAVVKANAKTHAKLLTEASTVIAGLVKENRIKVVPGYYDVANGMVTLLWRGGEENYPVKRLSAFP